MDYEIYQKDASLFHRPMKPEIRNAKPLHGLVNLIRNLAENDNKFLFSDVFPFSVESGNAFNPYPESGHKQVKSILSDIKRGNNPGFIPAFLAWLWYRHEKDARKLYDLYGYEYNPYIGHPSLDACPRFIEENFSLREQKQHASQNTNDSGLSNLPEMSNLKKRTKVIVSLLVFLLFVVTMVSVFRSIETEPPQEDNSRQKTVEVPNTFCVFNESNIAKNQTSISGQIMQGLNTPFKIDLSVGDYFHATENTVITGPFSLDYQAGEKIILLSRGRPVTISRSEGNGFIGMVENEKIFSFEINRENGKYTYSQYDYLDQPISSEKGYYITISFEYHLHRQNVETIEKYVEIDVYDSSHDPSKAVVNGVRQ